MIKVLYCFVLLTLAASCMTLSRQQRGLVRQFALKTENFSAFPEKMMTELADIREIRGIYYANSFNDPETHLKELDAVFKERLKDDRIPARVVSSFKILDSYADGLVKLSSAERLTSGNELYVQLGTELETLVGDYRQITGSQKLPAGLGRILSQSMEIGPGTLFAHKQCKLLKRFVNQADTLVAIVCDEMVNFVSSEGLGKLIQNEASGVTESFRFYFTKRTPPAIESEKEYISLMKRIEVIRVMQKQIIRAANNLKSVHKELARELNRGKGIREMAVELNDFYREVEKLTVSVRALTNGPKKTIDL